MNELTPIEREGQRVLTTAQLAEFYGTDSKVISKNFERNKEHYVEGKHYYCLTGDVLKEFKANRQFDDLPSNVNKLYLWTERGAFLHAKSLGTDKAWEVYDKLVDTYFRVKVLEEIHKNYHKAKFTQKNIANAIELIKEIKDTLRAQGSPPEEVTEAVNSICNQFGIRLPNCIVTDNPTLKEQFSWIDYIFKETAEGKKPTLDDWTIKMTVELTPRLKGAAENE